MSYTKLQNVTSTTIQDVLAVLYAELTFLTPVHFVGVILRLTTVFTFYSCMRGSIATVQKAQL